MSSSVPLRILSFAAFVLAALQAVQCQCKDYTSAETTTCSMLFQSFQSALVGSELNLYNLRKTFSPASHPAPILVNVSYEISFGHVHDDLCPGVHNDSSLFNTSVTHYLNYGWTSSAFYTFFHPAQLNRLQPQLVFLFVRLAETVEEDSEDEDSLAYALTWNGIGPIITAKLSLYIQNLPCSPSYDDVYDTLWDITSLLKIYTEVRTNLTTWKTDDAEYVIDGTILSTDWSQGKYLFGAILLVMLSLIFSFLAPILFFVITREVFSKAPKDTENYEFKMWHSLLWISFAVLAQFVVLVLGTDIYQVGIWCRSTTGCSIATVCRTIPFFTWLVIVIFLCCRLVLNRKYLCCFVSLHDFFQRQPQEKLVNTKTWIALSFFPLNLLGPFFCPFCNISENKCLSKILRNLFRVILLPVLFTFFSMVSFYLLPIILLFFVYPIKVATVYGFLTAALVLYILIAFYGEFKIEKSYDTNNKLELKKRFLFFYLIMSQLNLFFICAMMYLFFVVYITILSGGPQTSAFQAIISQLPLFILSSATWLFSKLFLESEQTPEPETPASSHDEETNSETSASFHDEETTFMSSQNSGQNKGMGLQVQMQRMHSNYGATN